MTQAKVITIEEVMADMVQGYMRGQELTLENLVDSFNNCFNDTDDYVNKKVDIGEVLNILEKRYAHEVFAVFKMAHNVEL